MTDTTMALRPERQIARSLWFWLTTLRRKSVPAAHLDTLSDHLCRDIGIERDEIDRIAIRTLDAAIRLSR